jgi:hypothetical protein
VLTLLASLISVGASAVAIEPGDAPIFEAFLEHVEGTASYCTPERLAEFAAQPEDIVWQASKYIRMPLTAYRLTGDAAHLDDFVTRMGALYDELEPGPDGFLGWYGLPLDLFRHPDHPDRWSDVILTSFVVAGLAAEFAVTIRDGGELEARHAASAARYVDIATRHLVAKWDARERYRDLGAHGAVYITNDRLAPVKADLTQPHNKHSKIGAALVKLHAATGDEEYLTKAVKLGGRYKRSLTLADDRYMWNYWDPAGAWDIRVDDHGRWKHWIGAEHRGGYYSLSLSQAVLLYEHGLVFDDEDIARFVRTQVEVCWNGDVENPTWRRVNGEEMDQSYLCSALAAYDESVHELAFGAAATARRIEQREHGWHGGVVAGDWLEMKYVTVPEWATEGPSDAAATAAYRASDTGSRLLAEMSAPVTGGGYEAPQTPPIR